MGIAVTVYLDLVETVPTRNAYDEDGELNDSKYIDFYNNPDYPDRIEPIKGNPAIYTYTASDPNSQVRLSYHGYNNWRERLAVVGGYPVAMCSYRNILRHDAGAILKGAGPFYELINFSDCEGTLGPTVAKKLAGDFVKYQVVAERLMASSELVTYNKFRIMFEQAASRNGALKFH